MTVDISMDNRMKLLYIVWLAFLASAAMYLLIGPLAAKNMGSPGEAGNLNAIRYSLYALAGVTFAVTGPVRKLILSSGSGRTAGWDDGAAFRKYFVAMIVALAMSESIGVYGLVLYLLGRNAPDLYVLIGVSAAAMVMNRPDRNEMPGLSQDGFKARQDAETGKRKQ